LPVQRPAQGSIQKQGADAGRPESGGIAGDHRRARL